MATSRSQSTFQNLGRSIEFTSKGPRRIIKTFSIYVPIGHVLVYSVNEEFGGVMLPVKAPRVTIDLVGPIEWKGGMVRFPAQEGSFGFLMEPVPGVWKMQVIAEGDHSINVNVAVIRKEPKSMLEWFGCNGCKKLLKAAIIGLVMLAANEGAGALLATLNSLREWFRRAMEMSRAAMREFLNVLGDMISEPIEKIMEWVCRKLGFCP